MKTRYGNLKGNRRGQVALTALAAFAMVVGTSQHAAAGTIIDFDSNPPLAQGPSTYEDAGVEQTISVDGISISGGVVLGLPTNFPASPYGTPPNVYGTGDTSIGADPSLQSTITINLNSSLDDTTVQGLLFNGETFDVSYVVDAYSGGTLVDTQAFDNIPPNSEDGFDTFSVASAGSPITQVTISPTDTSDGWDFIIDTVAAGEPISDSVPEPSTVGLTCLGAILLFAWNRKKGSPLLKLNPFSSVNRA